MNAGGASRVVKPVLAVAVAAVFVVAVVMIAGHVSRNRNPRGENIIMDNPQSSDRGELPSPLVNPRIVIEKSARKLMLHSGGKVVRTYRIGLGFAPGGDKEREGDGRTPEGEVYICAKNRKSKFYLSLGLSYPNVEDAARGLADRLITRTQHDRIVDAITSCERPPWDTKLGGEIFIHGNGSARDWTWGCIALDDADIRELFDAVPEGTEVVIRP